MNLNVIAPATLSLVVALTLVLSMLPRPRSRSTPPPLVSLPPRAAPVVAPAQSGHSHHMQRRSFNVASSPEPPNQDTHASSSYVQAPADAPVMTMVDEAKRYFLQEEDMYHTSTDASRVPKGQCGYVEVLAARDGKRFVSGKKIQHPSNGAPRFGMSQHEGASGPTRNPDRAGKSPPARSPGNAQHLVDKDPKKRDVSHHRGFTTQQISVLGQASPNKMQFHVEDDEYTRAERERREKEETDRLNEIERLAELERTDGIGASPGGPDGNLVYIRQKWRSPGLEEQGEEREYELDSCVNKRMVYCNTGGNTTPTTSREEDFMRKKGKALMLYMMHGWDVDDRPAEWSNAIHLWQHGLLPQSEETQLYDGIDYVFFRSNEDIQEIELCSQHKNVRVYWIHNVPCDLCAHHLMLMHLGFQKEFSAAVPSYQVWPYKTVIFLNSGVRGPLFGQSSSHWLDVLGMAGQSRNEGLYWEDALKFKTVGASSISWEHNVHAQSFFVSVPLAALDYYLSIFQMGCIKDKHHCIFRAELKTLFPLLTERPDFNAFSFSQNFTTNTKLVPFQGGAFSVDGSNPTTRYADPCQALFMKLGGGAWNSIPKATRRAVLRISHQMRTLSKQRVGSQARQVIEWLRGDGRKTRGGDASARACRWFRGPKETQASNTTSPEPTAEPLPEGEVRVTL